MVVRKRPPLTGSALVFVTTTVVDWTPVFSSPVCAEIVADQLRQTTEFHDVSAAAYVIIPSHVHLLLGTANVEKLSTVIQGFKSLTSRRIKPLLSTEHREILRSGTSYRLWKPRFDDLVIWSEKQFNVKADYIHNNPVKAGLVESASDYRFSSGSDWLTGEPGIIPIDKNWSWT